MNHAGGDAKDDKRKENGHPQRAPRFGAGGAIWGLDEEIGGQSPSAGYENSDHQGERVGEVPESSGIEGVRILAIQEDHASHGKECQECSKTREKRPL